MMPFPNIAKMAAIIKHVTRTISYALGTVAAMSFSEIFALIFPTTMLAISTQVCVRMRLEEADMSDIDGDNSKNRMLFCSKPVIPIMMKRHRHIPEKSMNGESIEVSYKNIEMY